MSDEFDDDDVPWADPKIQADYQLALGEFLVRFNGLENLIGDVLERALGKLGRRDLYRKSQAFEAKLYALELVCLALPKMHTPDFKKIRDLNGSRNTLAHGHFDQNPYSGDYQVVTQGKTAKIPLSTIHGLSEQAAAITFDVRHCMAFIWFDGIEYKLPHGARPPDS